MSTSQRVSRGFHRLGLFLAAIILLIGGSYWVFSAFDVTGIYWRHHKALMCAHDFLQRDEKRFWDLSYMPDNTEEVLIDLKALECSQPANDPLAIVQFGEVKEVTPSFSWISSFGSELLFPPILITALATLILACAAYGVIRTIGWVIGGFAAQDGVPPMTQADHPGGLGQMFKSGWVRLWVVASIVWLVGVGASAAYYVWGRDACYTFESISIADDIAPQDKTLAESIKNEITTKVFCGTAETSPLLTLEGLGERGAVKQVAFQWLEPQGWSMADLGMLDFLNDGEIKAAEIIQRVSNYLHRARLLNLLVPLLAALILPPTLLLLGIGVVWVRRGFATSSISSYPPRNDQV